MIDEQYCIFCTNKDSKVFSHMRGDCRIYKNFEGKEWSGNRCPACYSAYKKAYDAQRRIKKGHDVMGTLRVCKTCDKQFEVTLGKHKICEDCRSK